jgi:hypothetical protein
MGEHISATCLYRRTNRRRRDKEASRVHLNFHATETAAAPAGIVFTLRKIVTYRAAHGAPLVRIIAVVR